MKRWINALAVTATLGLVALSPVETALAADNKYTIALIPGLTTDPFYITMHKGADAAAKVLGVDLIFQGAPEFNPVTQVPVLNAVIARKPSAILIAPTDKVQLVEPLKKASEAGIPVITVDTFIGDGRYQTGSGGADFPLSYIASDNILGGEIAARALAKAIGDKGKVYVSNVKPGISTTDQREQGFKEEMKKHPNITVWRPNSTTTMRTRRLPSFNRSLRAIQILPVYLVRTFSPRWVLQVEQNRPVQAER